jgi:hypothetical protein
LSSAFENVKHLFAPLTANCRDFHERWARAGEAPREPGRLTGRWEGEWVSTAGGHRGPLRCVLEQRDADRWSATFRAGYAGILRACYCTELVLRDAGDHWTLNGHSDIGWVAGGVYEYDGDITDDRLVCRYRSRHDRGEFRLQRA